ncbi:MAG: hypothetical protein ACXVZW_04785 [Gaiellaceae bacterium]
MLGWTLGLALVLSLAFVVVAMQPVRSPWWLYADADAQYTASSADLMAGQHTFYLDHPGMPLEDLMAITFEGRYLAHKLLHPRTAPHGYAGARLLNLNDSRIWFRGFGALFYLFSAVVTFFVAGRWLRHWGWATVGGLLWLAAPDLSQAAIQFRPDPLLGGLTLLSAFVIVRAAEQRDAWLYELACFLIGFTITVKIHAAGLLLPLVLALALRPPDAWAQQVRDGARGALRRHGYLIGTLAAVWVAFAVLFNYERYPFDTTAEQWRLLDQIGLFFAAYAALILVFLALRRRGALSSRPLHLLARVFSPFHGLLLATMAVAIAIPGTLFLDDGLVMLVHIKQGLTGSGVNDQVAPFHIPWHEFLQTPLKQGLILFALAAAATVVGWRRKQVGPGLWFSGALALGLMGTARIGWAHYFVPAFVLCIPPAFWLLKQSGRLVAPVVAILIAAVILAPLPRAAQKGSHQAQSEEAAAAAVEQIGDQVLKPGEIGLVDDQTYPLADVRYWYLVQSFVQWSPVYPYRYLPAVPKALSLAAERGLRPSYLIGSSALAVRRTQAMTIAGKGYVVRPLPGLADPSAHLGVLELVHGEGIDRAFGHPTAAYDPWTGYMKTPSGQYYTLSGQEVQSPPRRRYVPRLQLWKDALGVYWNARGQQVVPQGGG